MLLLAVPALAGPAEPDTDSGGTQDVAAVVVDGAELFRLTGIPSYPAARRAREAEARIRAAAGDPGLDPRALTAVHTDLGVEIRAGETFLFRIFPPDAEATGLALPVVAEAARRRTSEAIEQYRESRSRSVLVRNGAVAAAIVLGAVLVVFALARAYRVLDRFLADKIRRHAREVEKRSLRVIRVQQILAGAKALLRILAVVLGIATVYLSLDAVLGLFPWTRGMARVLLHLVLDPAEQVGRSIVGYVPNLVFLLVLVLAVRFILSSVRLLFDRVGEGHIHLANFEAEWARPTYRIVRVFVLAFAVVVAYPYLPGADSEALKGVSLLLGLMLSLGSSSVIANIIAGYTMTYRRAFRAGDRIRVGEVFGEVLESKVLATRLRTPRNEEVIIPNSTILNSNVINYSTLSRREGLAIQVTVGIGYDTPWRQVEAMLLEAAGRVPGIEPEPAPFVLQAALGDFAVTYVLNAFTRDATRMLAVQSGLHREVLDVFNAYGVAIMTPAYEGDPPEPKLVPRERWFAAPAQPPGPG